MVRIEDCRVCKYRGHFDWEQPVFCDYMTISGGHSRLKLPPRADGRCPAFENGDPEQRVIKLDAAFTVQVKRNRPMKYDGDLMMALYRKGKSDGEIARIVGCDKSTVRGWRLRNKLNANETVGPPLTYDYGMFRELWEQNKSDREIARAAGCSHSTVSRWRRMQGLPSRAGRRRHSEGT